MCLCGTTNIKNKFLGICFAEMDENSVKDLLFEIDNDIVVKSLKIIGPEQFEVIIQCKLDEYGKDYEENCNHWLEHFQTLTKTNWIKKRRFAEPERYLYRRLYECQHSKMNKVTVRKRETLRNRNLNCTAKIDFKFKKITRNTIKNDIILKQGKNVVINIKFSHSHPVNIADTYSYLRISEQTRKLFYNYFSSGMTAASAKMYHELHINEIEASKDVLLENLTNAQRNPTQRQVNYLYKLWNQSEATSTCRENCDVTSNGILKDSNDSNMCENDFIDSNGNDYENDSNDDKNIVNRDIYRTNSNDFNEVKVLVDEGDVLNEQAVLANNEFSRIIDLITSNRSAEETRVLMEFNNVLKHIQTPTQAIEFLNENIHIMR